MALVEAGMGRHAFPRSSFLALQSYFENKGPIEKFLEISKDFPHNRCLEKPNK